MSTYPFVLEPMDHQKRALKRIVKAKGRQLLAVDAGLGKTKVVLDYAGMIAMSKGRCVLFVAAPLSAVDTWGDEATKHLPDHFRLHVHTLNQGKVLDRADELASLADTLPGGDTEHPVVVLVAINLDVFSHNRRVPGTKTVTTRQKMIRAVRSIPWDLGVVDESHRIKGHDSNVTRAMSALSDSFPRRLALTGTVTPNAPTDMYGQMLWVNDSVLETRWASFRNRYCEFGGWGGKEVVGYRNLPHLSQTLAPWVFTAEREHCLDLPPITDAHIRVDLSAKERRAYDQFAKEALAEIDDTTVLSPSAIAKWGKLRQVTSGFVRDTETDIVHELGTSKMDACVDKIDDLVAGGEKVVVFAHFVRDVTGAAERITKRLGDRVPVKAIWGDTPADERRAIRKQFLTHDGPMVVVAQMRTVSLSVNEFVAARHAMFLSYSERHDDYIQAKARLHRQGQEQAVTVWHVVGKQTLDEAIIEAYERKGKLEDAVLAEARRMVEEQR